MSTTNFFDSVCFEMQQKGINDTDIKKFNNSVTKFYLKCSVPNSGQHKNGLLIGKIQSGKTQTFIGLIAKCFDNGYDISIVLCGNKNNLRDQTKNRIQKSFDTNLVFVNDIKNFNVSLANQLIKNGKKIILILIKEQKNLSDLENFFKNSEQLRYRNILIIDDEGDQASLNNKKFSKKNNGVIQYSTVNKKITNFLKNKQSTKLGCVSYVVVTATPQAPLLQDLLDELSPDFIELIYPSNGYCGLQEFHSPENSINHIIEIESESEELNPLNKNSEDILLSLAMFFVSNAIRKKRNDFGKHVMLFHPSGKKIDQDKLAKKISCILNVWKGISDNVKNIGFSNIKKYLHLAYENYRKRGVNLNFSFEKLLPEIIECINRCNSEPIVINSSNDNERFLDAFETCILIGGNMVERGLTIDGLAITYIVRRSKSVANIDTSEQRARWLGYRSKYYDICTVFTTKKISTDFQLIWQHENYLWEQIEYFNANGVDYKNMNLKFLRNENLRTTRTSVAREKQISDKPTYGFHNQNSFINDKEIQLKNKNLISSFLKNYKSDSVEKKIGGNKYKIFKNVSLEKMNDLVFQKFSFSKKSSINKDFFKNIINLIKQEKKLSKNADVILMRYDNNSDGKREINENCEIESTLMQGKNNNYFGDREWPKVLNTQNKIQIQIFNIIPKNNKIADFYSPFFAVYVPWNKEFNYLVERG